MKIHILSSLLFITGISSGVFTALMMNDAEKTFALDYFNKYLPLNAINDALKSEVFFHSLINNLSLLLIIGIAGIFAWSRFIAYGALICKGVALGFSVAFILEGLLLKGALLILLSVIPQNLFFISALLFATSLATEKSRKFIPRSYIINFLMLSIPILVGCLIEAFLAPILTRLVI